MLRWTSPFVLIGCTTFATPDELELEEPAPPAPLGFERIPDEESPSADAPSETSVAVTPSEPSRAGPPGIPADARIELRRDACFGRCPVYRVVLTADRVQWHGERFVEVKGDDEASLSIDAFAELWRQLNEQDFAKLPDEYPRYRSPYCKSYATDSPSATVVLTATGVDERVTDYHGCRGNERLDAFRELERRIDEVADTARWVGRCGPERCDD